MQLGLRLELDDDTVIVFVILCGKLLNMSPRNDVAWTTVKGEKAR